MSVILTIDKPLHLLILSNSSHLIHLFIECMHKKQKKYIRIDHCIQRKVSEDAQSYNGPRTSRIVILLGYIFSILGGLLGLIIAIYLITRKDPVAKKHGRIQLLIFIFYLILLLILLLTGNITSDTLMQYSQLNLANLTNLTL